MKLEFSRQVFEKKSNIKFHENPSSGSQVVPCGRTDRHDEANSRFSQLCERAYKNFFTTYLLDNRIFKDKRAGYIANTSYIINIYAMLRDRPSWDRSEEP